MVLGLFRRKAKRRSRRKSGRKVRRGGKRKAFGGYMIKPDATLAPILGRKPLPPSKMTKKLWQYIKRKRLGRRG